MLELFLTIVLLSFGFYGWGTIFCRKQPDVGWCGLLGLAAAFIVGSLLHFWLPLKLVAPGFIFFGVGLALLSFRRDADRLNHVRSECFCAFFLLLLCVVFSSRGVIHGDTGSYHMQAVQWVSEEPAVWGLANLHGRFGFNSAWWVVAAMMQMPWLPPAGCVYLAIGLLAFFFGMLVVAGLKRLWNGSADGGDILLACSCYLWFRQLAGINNPSFGTDSPANLLGVAAAACLLRACLNRDLSWAGMGLMLSSLAATTKLSATMWLPGAFGVFLSVSLHLWRLAAPVALDSGYNAHPQKRGTSLELPTLRLERIFVLPVLISGLIVSLWMAGGYACSGYPFYPVRLLGISSLPWAVSSADMARDTAGIQNWPTRGGADSDTLADTMWRWIENQYGLTNMLFALLMILAGLAAIGLLAKAAFKMGRGTVFSKLAPFFLPSAVALCGLVFCFLAAPAMRFASGYFFAFVGILAAGISSILAIRRKPEYRALTILLVVSAILLNFSGAIARPPSLVGIPPLPAPAVEERLTKQGVMIRVSFPNRVAWNASRPSTPYFDPEIQFSFSDEGSVRMICKPKNR